MSWLTGKRRLHLVLFYKWQSSLHLRARKEGMASFLPFPRLPPLSVVLYTERRGRDKMAVLFYSVMWVSRELQDPMLDETSRVSLVHVLADLAKHHQVSLLLFPSSFSPLCSLATSLLFLLSFRRLLVFSYLGAACPSSPLVFFVLRKLTDIFAWRQERERDFVYECTYIYIYIYI